MSPSLPMTTKFSSQGIADGCLDDLEAAADQSQIAGLKGQSCVIVNPSGKIVLDTMGKGDAIYTEKNFKNCYSSSTSIQEKMQSSELHAANQQVKTLLTLS